MHCKTCYYIYNVQQTNWHELPPGNHYKDFVNSEKVITCWELSKTFCNWHACTTLRMFEHVFCRFHFYISQWLLVVVLLCTGKIVVCNRQFIHNLEKEERDPQLNVLNCSLFVLLRHINFVTDMLIKMKTFFYYGIFKNNLGVG